MKKEAIVHGVWGDLASRNDNWDKLDGVPEKVDLLTESKANKVEVDASLELKANKQQEAMVVPTLLNGHNPIDSTRRPRYRKNDLGQLVMTGGFVSANNNLPIFILPPEYRPDRYVNIPAFDGAITPKRLLIDPTNGDVRLFLAASGTFYLEDITIELEGR